MKYKYFLFCLLTFAAPVSAESAWLKSIPRQPAAAAVEFPLNIRAADRCQFGDLDAIGLEMLASPPQYTRLLLTVEPLAAPNASNSYTVDLTHRPLDNAARKSINLQVALPRPAHSTLYGIYLCKDSTGMNTCYGKPLIDSAKVIAQYGSAVRRDGIAPQDKNYYFKFIVIDQNGIYYPVRGMTDERYSELREMLAADPAGSGSAAALVERVRLMNAAQGSLNLKNSTAVQRISAPAVEIVLPRYNPERCKISEPKAEQAAK